MILVEKNSFKARRRKLLNKMLSIDNPERMVSGNNPPKEISPHKVFPRKIDP